MRFVIGLFIVSLAFSETQGKRDFTIEVDEFTGNITGSEIVKFVHNSLSGKKMLSSEFSLLKPIRDFNFKFSLNVFKRKNQPMNYITVNVNGCKSIASGKFPLFTAMFAQLERVSNLPLKDCVFLADTEYHVKNYSVIADDFPPVILFESWKVVLEFFSGKNTASLATLTGRIVKN